MDERGQKARQCVATVIEKGEAREDGNEGSHLGCKPGL